MDRDYLHLTRSNLPRLDDILNVMISPVLHSKSLSLDCTILSGSRYSSWPSIYLEEKLG